MELRVVSRHTNGSKAKGWLVLVEGRTLIDTPSILPLREAEKRGTWRISCG